MAVAALLGAVALAGCGSSSSSPSSSGKYTKVTLAQTSDSLAFASLDIAEAKGYFAAQGIKVDPTIVKGDAETIPAVISGRINFGATTTPPALKAMTKDHNLQMVAPLVGVIQQWILNKNSASKFGITSNMSLPQKVQRLKGAKLATLDIGGALEEIFNGVAKQAGVPSSAYSVTAISPYSSLLVAVNSGRVDGGLVAAPYGTESAAQGKSIMLANLVKGGLGAQYSHTAFSSVITSATFAKKYPKLVKGMNTAVGEGLHYIHAHPSQAVTLLHDQFFHTMSTSVLRQFINSNDTTYPTSSTITPAVFTATRGLTGKFVDPSANQLSYAQQVAAAAK